MIRLHTDSFALLDRPGLFLLTLAHLFASPILGLILSFALCIHRTIPNMVTFVDGVDFADVHFSIPMVYDKLSNGALLEIGMYPD